MKIVCEKCGNDGGMGNLFVTIDALLDPDSGNWTLQAREDQGGRALDCLACDHQTPDPAFPYDMEVSGANRWTVFCQQVEGRGTIWIDSVEAETAALASQAGAVNCAADWGCEPSDVWVLGVARGNVEIAIWEDLNVD